MKKSVKETLIKFIRGKVPPVVYGHNIIYILLPSLFVSYVPPRKVRSRRDASRPAASPHVLHPRVSRDLHVLTFYYNGSPDISPFDLYCPCRSYAYYVHLDMYLFNIIPSPPSPRLRHKGFFFIYLFIFIYFLIYHPSPRRTLR